MSPVYDLEDRLVEYAAEVILFTKTIPSDYAGQHLAKQLIRSSTSPALNYGEAQGAESIKDFIHKNKIVIKELKESRVCKKILKKINYGQLKKMELLLNECEQLIAIFSTIVKKSKDKL